LLQNNQVVGNISAAKQTSENNSSWSTHRERVVNGDDAGPQGLHVLIIFEPILLPRGVIPIN
jgi:hypothetical protein